MIYNLSVFDRILLLNILPEQEEIDRIFYNLYHCFLCDLSFTEEEYNNYQITYGKDGLVNWKNDEEKPFSVNDIIKNIIIGRLKACKENSLLLNEYHDNLYNKFVEK